MAAGRFFDSSTGSQNAFSRSCCDCRNLVACRETSVNYDPNCNLPVTLASQDSQSSDSRFTITNSVPRIGWSQMSGRRTSGSSRPSLGARVLSASFPSFLGKIAVQRLTKSKRGLTNGGLSHGLPIKEGPTSKFRHASIFRAHSDTQAVPTLGHENSAQNACFFSRFLTALTEVLGRDIRADDPRMSAGCPSEKLPLGLIFRS